MGRAYQDRYDAAFDGREDDERGPAQPKFAVIALVYPLVMARFAKFPAATSEQWDRSIAADKARRART
jgi:hypothetical protein